MRTQIRIVAGSLRGRKLTCTVTPKLRPTPQLVREALFSILGNAVPGRPFWDVFAGTGIIGLEALSRGATVAYFIERDFRFADTIDKQLREFDLTDCGRVVRADVYRWVERLPEIAEPVTVFLSPPFADYQHRPTEFMAVLSRLQAIVPIGSVICLQGEQEATPEPLPHHEQWDKRRYGRNELWFWTKESNPERNGHAAEVAALPSRAGPMTEREFAIDIVRRLRDAGFQALWAGGCVRDELLGLVPKDYDVATDARPEQVRKLFRRTIAVGASFGVIEVLGPRTDEGFLKVQVATFRSDGAYSDGRRPDEVVFSSPEEDAKRRDFTINGMFFDPLENQLIDYVGGQADLAAKVLRAIGNPALRFTEDKLRLLRAVRMAARFGFTIEAGTEAAIRVMALQIRVVAAERIADELRKMLVDPNRARGMHLFVDLGLAAPVMPELPPMKGLKQGPPDAPTGDLWDHVLRVLELLSPKPSFPLALAALLHDVGKPRTVGRTPDRYTFHGHEHVGRRLASEISLRLKLSNDERERVEWLVEKHQFLADAKVMRLSKLKVTLAHAGIRELLELHRADALASGRGTDHVDYCERLLREWGPEVLNPPPLITGNDLQEKGLEPGPLFKRLLDAVREAQLEGTVTTKDQALGLVDRLLAEPS